MQQQQIPIDEEIKRVKVEIEKRRLQLKQVNTGMANTRAHYQQGHLRGGGKVGGFIRLFQGASKDAKLKKQQPVKEQLQKEKQALEEQLSNLKILKLQGITHVTYN